MSRNIPLNVTYYQTADGEITEGFSVETPDNRLRVTTQRHGYDSYLLWTFDRDTDAEPVKAPVKFTFRDALAQAMIFCGMVPEVAR